MNYETATNEELNFELSAIVGGEWKDYCSDWNATMPLAIEHNVFFDLSTYGGYSAYQQNVVSTTQYTTKHHTVDKDPFRAIVICLIKVLEGKI